MADEKFDIDEESCVPPETATGGEVEMPAATAHTGDAEKTKYCNRCHKRHPLNHEHFADGRTDNASTVVGAQNAAELGAQVRARISGKKGATDGKDKAKNAAEKLASVEAEQRRQRALKRWGSRMAKAPFTALSLATSNPQWRQQLRDEEITELADEWQGVLDAFGFTTGGKIVAVMSILVAEAEAIGAVYGRVKEWELTHDGPNTNNARARG